MSIMQEYKAIKKQLGDLEWNRMEKFLEVSPNMLLSDLLYNQECYEVYEQWKMDSK